MKQYSRSILACFMLITGMSALCFAATLDQIAGEYTLLVEEKVSVKKIGKDKWIGQNILTVNANGTWFDNWDGQGTIEIDAKGKKALLYLDNAAIEDLEDVLVDWAYDAALAAGVSASDLDFTFTDLQARQCKIDKKTNKLAKKIKVKGVGFATGTVDGESGARKFKYSLKAVIL